MQAHALTITLMDRTMLAMTDEQRIEFMNKQFEENDKKFRERGKWSELSDAETACDWPAWLQDLIKKLFPHAKWDKLNAEYKAAFITEQEADKAAAALNAMIESYVKEPGRAEEAAWHSKTKKVIRVRPCTAEYMDMDRELSDNVEEIGGVVEKKKPEPNSY